MGLSAVISRPWLLGLWLRRPNACKPLVCRITTRLSAVASKNASPSPWTKEDVDRLMTMKAENKPTSEILAAFPGRTLTAIAVKWCKVAPRGQSGRPVNHAPEGKYFTDEEQKKIHQLRQDGLAYAEIQREHFPARSVQAVRKSHTSSIWIQTPAKHRNSKWTSEEDQKLLDLRLKQKMDIRSAALELGRSYNSLVDRWREIAPRGSSKGATRAVRSDSFTVEEDHELLEKYQAGAPISQIAAEISSRTPRRVQNRIMYLMRKGDRDPIYRRRPEEIRQQIMERLRDMAKSGMSFKHITEQLPHVPVKTLQRYYYKLDATHRATAAKRNFTLDDDEMITQMVKNAAGLKAIRTALNDRFSDWHIKHRIVHLGLQEDWRRGFDGLYKLFTPEDDNIIIEMSRTGATRNEIRAALEKSYSLFQLRRRIKVLEERESFKAKTPLHWQVRSRGEAASNINEHEASFKLKPGTAEADEKTMSMAHSGNTARQILEVVDYSSVNASRARLRELGDKWGVQVDQRCKNEDPNFTVQDDDKIAEMYRNGMSLADINTALKWQFTFRAVEKRIKHLAKSRGILRERAGRQSKVKQPISSAAITASDDKFVRMYKDNATDAELMQALNIQSRNRLKMWIKDLRRRQGIGLPRRAGPSLSAEQSQKRREREQASRAKHRDPNRPPINHRATFNPEDDKKLIELVKEGFNYERLVAAFDGRYSRYKLRLRRADLGLPDLSRRGRQRNPESLSSSRAPLWSLGAGDKDILLDLRAQGLSWQEMAAQVPHVPEEVVQDYYFYGKQIIKLRLDGTVRKSKSATAHDLHTGASPDSTGEVDGDTTIEQQHNVNTGAGEGHATEEDVDVADADKKDESAIDDVYEEEEFEYGYNAWEHEHEDDEDDEDDDEEDEQY